MFSDCCELKEHARKSKKQEIVSITGYRLRTC